MSVKKWKKEIEELQAKIEIAQGLRFEVRSVDSFSDKEKVKVFDALHKEAYEHVQFVVENGRSPKDGDHWMYEAVMERCLGRVVWDIINQALRG